MVCFGEILWDCLPSGRVISGAYLNIAVQMHNLGLSSTLISAIGKDDLGDEMIRKVRKTLMNSKTGRSKNGQVTPDLPNENL
ncbi:MAG: hypothetical protein V3V00_12110 [Saprospiraceae bacterium]